MGAEVGRILRAWNRLPIINYKNSVKDNRQAHAARMMALQEQEELCIMEIIVNWLISGYVVGITCMSYFIIKSWILVSPVQGRTEEEHASDLNWLGMALVSTSISLAWSFIGTGISLLLQNDVLYVQLALLATLATVLMYLSLKNHRKLDKVALHAIVFLGLALLLPRFF